LGELPSFETQTESAPVILFVYIYFLVVTDLEPIPVAELSEV